ncbi:hypothetical protein [Aquabacter spiritensis]|uniref:Uncharacterized protein n=1 Tax=Aquabacter spiritensis TaxID=933073 RepID=A0A4R3M6P9_9HYPH|nr:hypothetical protein [Aquabacter spiritensis]TCT07939.1 hypothetical protein EDC64_101458 [Aquabacter spiritensis]
MTSFPVDLLLLAALVVTSGLVIMLRRRLKALRASQADYEQMLGKTTAAFEAAREAVIALNGEGRALVTDLGSRIEEAQRLLAELDRRDRAAAPQRIPVRVIHSDRR